LLPKPQNPSVISSKFKYYKIMKERIERRF